MTRDPAHRSSGTGGGGRGPLRIAYLRISQETNAFSPVESTWDDFRRLHFFEGAELEERCRRFRAEVKGFARNAELSGFMRAARRFGKRVETIPLFSAWALPSGPLSEETFLDLRRKLVTALENAGPLDGVFFVMHGAMRARGAVIEPEESFLEAIREVVGPDLPVAVTIDLHAQLTPKKVELPTILAAYQTNPHRDLAKTGDRAGTLLIRTILGDVRPVSAWRTLPMFAGGGSTLDFLRPMRPIFRRMKRMERDPRVLHVSLCMSHPWNDSPDLGWSTHVITDNEPELAEELATELAELAWSVRHLEHPRILTASEGLEKARKAWWARRLGTVCIVDASDAVGAGGTGENTELLRVLLAEGNGLRAFVPLRDAVAVEALWSHRENEAVQVSVGGHLDPERNPPVEVDGILRRKKATARFGRAVVLQLGSVHLVLTELAPYTLKPAFYFDVGLNPWLADLVVVKSLFHFRIYYWAMMRRTFLVGTRGATDLGVVWTVKFNGPVFPKDDVEDWRAADRRRRGVTGEAGPRIVVPAAALP